MTEPPLPCRKITPKREPLRFFAASPEPPAPWLPPGIMPHKAGIVQQKLWPLECFRLILKEKKFRFFDHNASQHLN
jgi:hypothetical protein